MSDKILKGSYPKTRTFLRSGRPEGRSSIFHCKELFQNHMAKMPAGNNSLWELIRGKLQGKRLPFVSRDMWAGLGAGPHDIRSITWLGWGHVTPGTVTWSVGGAT